MSVVVSQASADDEFAAELQLGRFADAEQAYQRSLAHGTGHPAAAHTARQQAISTYLPHRHAGGASQHPDGLFDRVAQAITQHTIDQTARNLAGHAPR